MKKIFKTVGVFLVVLLITGCMDVKTIMKVNNDKSFDINMTMKLDLLKYTKMALSFDPDRQNITEEELKQYLDEEMNSGDFNLDEFMDDEEIKEMEKQGYKVDVSVDKENYIYQIIIIKHFETIDDASKTEEESNKTDEETSGEFPNTFFIKTSNNTYKFDINNDLAGAETDPDDPMNEIISNIADGVTYSYEITLPNKPISNNATKVSADGKTLTWELGVNDKNKVEFEFAFPETKEEDEAKEESKESSTKESTSFLANMSKEQIFAIGLIGVGSLTLVAATIAYIASNKKNK